MTEEQVDWCSPFIAEVKVVQAVSELLKDDALQYCCGFPLKEAVTPTDPAACDQWYANIYKEIAAEMQYPAGKRPFSHDYSGNSWLPSFLDELRLSDIPHIFEKCEVVTDSDCIFETDDMLKDQIAQLRRQTRPRMKGSRLFYRATLKEVVEHAALLEWLHSVFGNIWTGQKSHEELTNMWFRFRVSVKAPLALVPKTDDARPQCLGGAFHPINNPTRLSLAFGDQITRIFYSSKQGCQLLALREALPKAMDQCSDDLVCGSSEGEVRSQCRQESSQFNSQEPPNAGHSEEVD
jgi:hypothetical protein